MGRDRGASGLSRSACRPRARRFPSCTVVRCRHLCRRSLRTKFFTNLATPSVVLTLRRAALQIRLLETAKLELHSLKPDRVSKTAMRASMRPPTSLSTCMHARSRCAQMRTFYCNPCIACRPSTSAVAACSCAPLHGQRSSVWSSSWPKQS